MPSTWTGPLATGLVDQDELDAVLLNWGVAAAALAAPAQAPLVESTVGGMTQSGTPTNFKIGDALSGTNPAKTARKHQSPSNQLCNDVRESAFAQPRNRLILP
jgi:hypothetical protein